MGVASAPRELREALDAVSPEERADFLVAIYFAAGARGLIDGVTIDPEIARALTDFSVRAELKSSESAEAHREKVLSYFARNPLRPELMRLLREISRDSALERSIADPSRTHRLIGAAQRTLPTTHQSRPLLAQLVAVSFRQER
jgi:hypothetical protein